MTTLRLQIDSPSVGSRSLRFQRMPVRIGRDPSSDCQLDLPFVSATHARLEIQAGRLLLRDEGSETGVRVNEGKQRVPAMECVDLAKFGNEFLIGSCHFRAELVQDEDPEAIDEHEGAATRRSLVPRGVRSSDENAEAAAFDERAYDDFLWDALEEHGAAVDKLEALLLQLSSGAPLPMRQRYALTIVEADPEWDAHSSIRRFVEESGARAAPTRLGATALDVLEEFRAFHVPATPALTSVEAVTAFVERIDRVLSDFIEGIAVLVLEYRGMSGGPPEHDDPRGAALASLLLDWTADRAAVDRLRNEMAMVIAEYRRLVAEPTTSLEGILNLLDPSTIEQACSPTPAWNPFRYRALWNEFVRRYQELRRPRAGRTSLVCER